MLLILCFFIYKYYKKSLDGGAFPYIFMNIMLVVSILIHEASFFFLLPIIFVHYFWRLVCNKQSYVKSFIRSLLFFSMPIATMMIVCVCKGGENIANDIWSSWSDCMTRYPLEGDSLGLGVGSLTWDTISTFGMHLRYNFTGFFWKFIPSFPFLIYLFVAIYYLLMRMNTVDLRLNELKPYNTVYLSNIVLLQFVFMIPMFTVLSCDWGRTIPYWTISSIFFYHVFKNDTVFDTKYLNVVSNKFQSLLSRVNFLNKDWVYFIVLFTLPLQVIGSISYRSGMLGVLRRIVRFVVFNYFI